MKTGSLMRCLEDTIHHCGFDKALHLLLLDQGDRDISAEWRRRFELVKANVKNALAQLERIRAAATDADCQAASQCIDDLRRTLNGAKRKCEEAAAFPPALYLLVLQGDVRVALVHLMYLLRLANESPNGQLVVNAWNEQTVSFGHEIE